MAIVSLLGRGEPPLDFNPLAMEHFYLNGISLIAVNEADPDLYPAGPRESSARPYRGHLLRGPVRSPNGLVTHRLHYTQIAEAYEMVLQRDKSMLNVVFDWSDA